MGNEDKQLRFFPRDASFPWPFAGSMKPSPSYKTKDLNAKPICCRKVFVPDIPA
ncbi:hypothetical protein MA16_Dca002386 [Dendrobium catenatum]|uniref:Uncharacterized protein n=1 Tax=Dendrobium catenatum TaxID=906689 RepID=A0A2I0W0D8_9ASPA|nr:hypothetical protein MA16_Dca002386 [Dendrobium catenatum]